MGGVLHSMRTSISAITREPRMQRLAGSGASGALQRRLGRLACACACPGSRQSAVRVHAEKKEYYDYKDMPPLPHVPISRIHVPEIGYTVVDQATESLRTASLAIFYDIFQDDQYGARLSRKSAMTALCMYDRDDVEAARSTPGDYPNIDLLYKVYEQGLEYSLVVEEAGAGAS